MAMGDSPGEKWITRELICLACVFSWAEDKDDWSTISRKVSRICSEQGRPKRWYTQERCKNQMLNLFQIEAEALKKAGKVEVPTIRHVLNRLRHVHHEEIAEMIRQIDIDNAKEEAGQVEPY